MFFETSGLRIFSISGIDVSVSFWYGALMVMIVLLNPGLGGILFAAAITVSVLIHEFGHAVPSKIYGLRPSILLHGFGGLCAHQPADSDWKHILILVMGPGVEIFFGLAALGAMMFVSPPPALATFLVDFAWVSIVWGGVNLVLPLFPLDGGQLFHLFLRRFMNESKAQDLALKVSIGVALPIGVVTLVEQWFFATFMIALIVMDNYNTLRHGTRLIDRRAKVRASDFVKENMAAAEKAFADEDWREAARLCHVLRSSNDAIPPKQMDRLWVILGLATTRLEDWEDAAAWLDKAPDTPEVRAAREECAAHLAEDAAQ